LYKLHLCDNNMTTSRSSFHGGSGPASRDTFALSSRNAEHN
jgi:hypothetical protein